jgi:hypothetical protein
MTVLGAGFHHYVIRNYGGNWWIAYNGDWMGYFPGALWNGSFQSAGLLQWFGEVAAPFSYPCTDMGSGALPGGAWWANANFSSIQVCQATANPYANITLHTATMPSWYGVAYGSPSFFRYGGPGAC